MALLRENYFKIHFALWRFAGCVETFNHILALSGQRGFTSAHLLDNLWRVVNWFLPKFPPPFVLWYLIVVMKFVYGLVELVHIKHLEWQHKREMQQILHTTIIVITIITTTIHCHWNSNTLATWCEEQTHWKRPWCWERLKAGGEGDDRGWDAWMASPTQWKWVWASSKSWWWTGKPGMLQSMGSQRVGHDWVTEMNDMLSKAGNIHI